MKVIENFFYDVAVNVKVFWYGWLMGVIGTSLGIIVGHILFGG
jgi:hypothetical protein